MSNESIRPWYRNPAYLSIIAVVLAAIISSPIWYPILNPPPADFSISVNPMQGSVQQGGVVQTTVTIKSIHRYKHPVSLSASGQPSDIVITFIPPIGGPTPAYASTVTINVTSNVPASDHSIIIKGTGADGKEHTCTYILTVKPMSVTPTFEIKITSPKKGDEIPVSIIVSGTFRGKLPEGQYMWVVINPHRSPDQWWPQVRQINPREGYQWEVPAWLGREKEDINKKFDIAVILVNENDDQYYQDYLRIGQETGSYPGIPLPASANIIDRITTTRK